MLRKESFADTSSFLGKAVLFLGLLPNLEWVDCTLGRRSKNLHGLAAALDDAPGRVEWMPAHTSESDIGVKLKGNGRPITEIDRSMNDYVDLRAKEAAGADRVPIATRRAVTSLASKLTAVAMWLGVCTAAVNRWPRPDGDSASGTLRDCEPAARHSFRGAKER